MNGTSTRRTAPASRRRRAQGEAVDGNESPRSATGVMVT